MILLDTSGLLAALFADQKDHDACARALRKADPPRIISAFVLAELDYLIVKHAGVDAETRLLDEIARRVYEVVSFGVEDIAEARAFIARYRDLKIALADASICVLANRYGIRDVLTLDERHFRAIHPAPRARFRILPADQP